MARQQSKGSTRSVLLTALAPCLPPQASILANERSLADFAKGYERYGVVKENVRSQWKPWAARDAGGCMPICCVECSPHVRAVCHGAPAGRAAQLVASMLEAVLNQLLNLTAGAHCVP